MKKILRNVGSLFCYMKPLSENTPLITVPYLSQKFHLPHLLIKDESCNPFGTFKDRRASIIVRDAVEHNVDIHKKFEFGLTSEIEGMFGNLRTFIRRMYHHMTPEQLPELVGEFCLRFSQPEIFDSPQNYLQNCLKLVPFD